MFVNRAFKFRLKPNIKQRDQCQRFAGGRRWIFNYGLEERQKAYQETGKTVSYFEQNMRLVFLKEQSDTLWLQEIHSQVLQQGLKDLDNAYKNFFRKIKKGEKPGHPRFKKRGVRDSFRFPQGVKIEGSKVFLPKIGWVKFRKSQEILGTVQETTVMQEGDHWYVSFSCEWEPPDPTFPPITEERAIGIDLGVSRFATTASGKESLRQDIIGPRPLKRILPHLKQLSRRLSKKTKGSKNRLKAQRKLSKCHAKVKNIRTDFAQQLSTKLIKTHDIFCIENLDISSLLQKSSKGLSRSIADVGWRSFLNCLKYKAEEKGKYIVEAGRYFPSSQLCSSCNHRKEMPLSLREYHCPNCGLKIDRDYNSAIDLKTAGMSVLNACGATIRSP